MPLARVLALSVVCCLVLAAGGSSAYAQGTYTVRACWYDLVSNWQRMEIGHIGLFGPSVNGCNHHDEGMQSEGYPMAGAWPLGNAFGWQFTAPPRTHISAFTAEVSGHSGHGVNIPQPWFRGFWDPDGDADWESNNTEWTWSDVIASGLSLQRLAFGLRCTHPTCGFPSDGIRLGDYDQLARARDIVVTVSDAERPAIEMIKSLPTGWRSENAVPLSFTASDNVGVHRLVVTVDDAPAADLLRSCFAGDLNAVVRPCAETPAPLSANLEVAGLSDGAHGFALQQPT